MAGRILCVRKWDVQLTCMYVDGVNADVGQRNVTMLYLYLYCTFLQDLK